MAAITNAAAPTRPTYRQRRAQRLVNRSAALKAGRRVNARPWPSFAPIHPCSEARCPAPSHHLATLPVVEQR
jgi:hypothetical protein